MYIKKWVFFFAKLDSLTCAGKKYARKYDQITFGGNGFGRGDVFALLAFTPYLLIIRTPSDALCLRRGRDSERLADFVPQADKPLIGARACGGAPCLILKCHGAKTCPEDVSLSGRAFAVALPEGPGS